MTPRVPQTVQVLALPAASLAALEEDPQFRGPRRKRYPNKNETVCGCGSKVTPGTLLGMILYHPTVWCFLEGFCVFTRVPGFQTHAHVNQMRIYTDIIIHMLHNVYIGI